MFTLALTAPARRQGLPDPYQLQHADELLVTPAEETERLWQPRQQLLLKREPTP